MLDSQENKLTMYKTTGGVVMENTSIWQAFPAFVDAVTRSGQLIAAIDAESAKQEKIMVGRAEDKEVAKYQLSDVANVVAFKIRAYAAKTSNNELKQAMNYRKSDLLRTRDTILPNKCKDIYDKAQELLTSNPTEMANYKLTSALVTSLNTAITKFNSVLLLPRKGTIVKGTSTEVIADLFRQADDLLKYELDALMLEYKTSYPNFYKDYFRARTIVDIGIRHKKEETPE